MTDLSRRATDPERLDEGVPDAEALASLADLRFVNRWLGNRAAFTREVARLLRGLSAPRLLDVGCGSADVPALVSRELACRPLAVGLDVKPLHLRQVPPEVAPVCANVHALPFASASFDVVTASLFLHHFDAPAVAGVLRALFSLARRGLVVNDLRRARLPHAFGRVAFPVLFRSRVSVEDGLVSIRRGFTEGELRASFAEAGIPVRIERTWPYRLLAVAERVA
jgi:SAM-dependent methyltransferase